jgi:hydrophobe/amphiphile efflux-1 (HAE1) family protein
MHFTDTYIRRPVLASVISLLILLIGLVAAFKLPVRYLPDFKQPVITINTTYPGASADVMQGFVTSIIEQALTGIDGVNFVQASSSQGSSSISVNMKLGVNDDAALTNVMEKVASVRGRLPKNIEDPIINKETAGNPHIMFLSFTSKKMTNEQVGDYLNRVIQPKLSAIEGVGQVTIWGGQFAMRIWLDPALLAAHNVTPTDVQNALQQQNVQSAAGNTDGKYVSFNVNISSTLTTAEEFNNIILRNDNGILVRLKDVGYADLGKQSYKINSTFNGQLVTVVAIDPLPDANPLNVAARVHQALPALQKSLPYDMKTSVIYDQTASIRDSVYEVVKAIFEATFIVVIVIFLFIGSVRSVIIPIVTIPLSLIGVCFFMMVAGYSLNTLTLLAMVLAIGLVVDDAIVVVENIFRHIEEGSKPLPAALNGAREIASSVVAMTITLAAVYAPIGFMKGLTGQLFTEFAWTLAAAVVISGIIALTLSPMMCSKLLSHDIAEARLVKLVDSFFSKTRDFYTRVLRSVLTFRAAAIIVWITVLIATVLFYLGTPAELAPAEDNGFLMAFGNAPASSNSDYLSKYSRSLDGIYRSIPDVTNYLYINGIPSEHQLLSVALLKPTDQRKTSIEELQVQIQQKLNNIAGLKTFAVNPSPIPGSSDLPIGFVLTSTSGYEGLYEMAEKLKNRAMASGLFIFMQSDLQYDQPAIELMVDRNAAADLGISMNAITDSLSILLSEGRAQNFIMQGRSYDVIPLAQRPYRLNPSALNQVNVRTKTGELVPLSTVVSIKSRVQPSSLNRFQQLNAVTLTGMMMPPHSLSEGLDYLKHTADEIIPKSVMSYDYTGQSRQFRQEGNALAGVFLVAIIVIFLVLAAQFESYRDPLIILLGSVPMSLCGALSVLFMGMGTINIYTQVGLLTLVGLISKHGILMTKFANELQVNEGLGIYDAIIKSSSLRLRPILMTTAAMIFGVLPLIASHGAGAVSRRDMGIVITFGMLIGTFFTLFIVPVLYTMMATKHHAVDDEEVAVPESI